MSADKFPWIFSRQMEAIVYIAVTEKYGRRVLKRILKLQYGLEQKSLYKNASSYFRCITCCVVACFLTRDGFREIFGWKNFIGSGTTASSHYLSKETNNFMKFIK